MEEVKQNSLVAMTPFLEGLKYFIKTREESLADFEPIFYLVTVSTKLKIPISLKSEILNGRIDWIDDIEFSDTKFKDFTDDARIRAAAHDAKVIQSVTQDVIVKQEVENSSIIEDKKSQADNISLGHGVVGKINDSSDNDDDNFENLGEHGIDALKVTPKNVIENISDTIAIALPEIPRTCRKKRKCVLRNDHEEKSRVDTENFSSTEKTNATSKSKKKIKEQIPCEHCGKCFRSLNHLQYHLPIHITERLFKCTFCSKSFKSEPVLRRHLYFHSGLRPFSCDICGKTFNLNASLQGHIRCHTGEKPFICHICGKQFRAKGKLRIHVLKHGDARPWKCEFCPKSFVSKAEVTQHTRIHTETLKFQCELCGKKFRTQGSLNVHVKIHSSEKPHVCSLCNIGFATDAYLKKHTKTHKNLRNYKCDVCGKLFKCNSNLKKHQVTHSDARPFKCDICQKDFKLFYVLQQHAKMHQDVKEYKCQYCGKHFSFNSSLYSHLKVHHKDEQLE